MNFYIILISACFLLNGPVYCYIFNRKADMKGLKFFCSQISIFNASKHCRVIGEISINVLFEFKELKDEETEIWISFRLERYILILHVINEHL